MRLKGGRGIWSPDQNSCHHWETIIWGLPGRYHLTQNHNLRLMFLKYVDFCNTCKCTHNGGGVQTGGASRSGLVLPFLSFFVPFCLFWDFPDFHRFSRFLRGFPRLVLFLFLGLLICLKALARNRPQRVRDTIGTIPEKSGKPPGLETPWFGK